ncbi:MAG: hypothetical protein L0220_21845, partial [Acidobacteria bacterium]|nr:hypothetical protein [Acidobacteriota bacterium]
IAQAAFSPGGDLIAYSLSSERESSLWIKQVIGDEEKRITYGSWRDRNPIWSPDRQHLAFISNRGGVEGIWKVPFLGGKEELLKEIEMSGGMLTSWSKDGRRI